MDTNVLVSGLLSPFNAPGEIVRMTSAGMLEVCYDARIFSEYREVLLRAEFSFGEDSVEALLELIRAAGQSVVGRPLRKRLPDPSDEVFLEVAIAGNVERLVTGNLKHFPADRREGVKVVSPAEFLEFYRKGMS